MFSDRVGDAARVFPDRAVTASTRVFSDRVGDAARVLSNRAVDAAAAEDPELRALLEKLQNSLSCLQAGGEIPCHFTTLTTAIYHWQDLAQILQKYDAAVTRRRHGRSDPLEPAERKLSLDRRLVLKYPGVVEVRRWRRRLRVGCRRHHALAFHQFWRADATRGPCKGGVAFA